MRRPMPRAAFSLRQPDFARSGHPQADFAIALWLANAYSAVHFAPEKAEVRLAPHRTRHNQMP
ncbi:MAG: hypothetical protein WAK98_12060, partial [Gemmobacter sp.]